jgi:serine/threonine-protein kinase
MTPERFRRVDQLVSLALERPTSERAEFVREACAGEEDLRIEVESLLATQDKEDGFLAEAPARLAAELLEEKAEQEIGELSPTVLSEDGATEPSVDAAGEQLQPGSPLGRYVVRERLGTGGMGVVYGAQDTELNRKIAIKLMRPGASGNISASEGRARLMREAQAMAQLAHPNVIAVHDVGTFGDQVFIAMEYVEGSTLTHWLAEQDRPWREIVNMFVQTGRGLAAAHAGGILHRDFKPDNVLVGKEGRPRVLDFGLARALFGEPEKRAPDDEPAGADATSPNLAPLGAALTQPGRLMGTPAYMAPEQLMGQGADHRTDQYSFCVALYQGLYGELPFKGQSIETLVREVSQGKAPEAPSSQVPSRLRRAVLRGLRPKPAERYPSMEALLDELVLLATRTRRRLMVVVPVVLLLVGIGALAAAPGLGWYFLFRSDTRIVGRRDGEPIRAAEPKSIAVLPFVNMSSDKENEYLSDGMTEELINALSNVDGLRVASRTSAFAFKGKDVDIRQIGERLSVGTVLEGSVRREGNTLRVTAQLVQVSDGYHLWSKSYDRELKSVFALEEDIARSIADALQRKLVAVKAATTNLDAHDLYLRGLYFLNRRTVSALVKAAEYFEQAIVQDPRYALAYVGLADATRLRIVYDAAAPAEVLPRAKEAALRALALDPALAEAHTSMGNIYEYDYQFPAALQEFRTALALKPDYPTAHQWYGQSLQNLGRLREAQAELDRALELDPASSVIKVARASVLVSARDYEGALAQYKKVLEMDPDFNPVHANLASTYALQGKYAEALAEVDKMREAPDVWLHGFRAWVYALSGRRSESLELVRGLEERSRHEYVSHVGLGNLWMALNDKDRAFAHLMKACEVRDPALGSVKVDPVFDAARADPRFQDLLRCVHLE